MSRLSRGMIRSAAVLALLVLTQPFAELNLADPAKDFPLCIQACNDARRACDDQCMDDCATLFPGSANKQARDACITACKATCTAQSDACKRVCQEIRDGGTPPQP